MRRTVPSLTAAALTALGVLLAGCSGSGGDNGSESSDKSSQQSEDSDAAGESGGAGGSSDDAPATGFMKAPTDLLSWEKLDARPGQTVLASGSWRLVTGKDGRSVRISGPKAYSVAAAPGKRVSKVMAADGKAVVVSRDPEDASADSAVVIDLASGKKQPIAQQQGLRPNPGANWSLGEGRLTWTRIKGRQACLSSAPLQGTMRASDLGCAPRGRGWSEVTTTRFGQVVAGSATTKPCYAIEALTEAGPQKVPGPARCKAWEGARVGDDAYVWNEILSANRTEEGVAYATGAKGKTKLGPITSGSLTPCAGAVYWVRPSTTDKGKAAVVRYRDGKLATVFESKAGPATISPTLGCGGDRLTVASDAEGGDQLVTATLS